MKLYFNKSRVASAALLSLLVAAGALVVSAAPAFAMAFSSARVPGHGFSAPVQASGSGSALLVGWIVVAAIVAATVAFAVIGWRYDRRRVAQAQQADSDRDEADRPSASKPLPLRTAPAVRARRGQGVGDQSHKPTV
jgi:amino acid transporter